MWWYHGQCRSCGPRFRRARTGHHRHRPAPLSNHARAVTPLPLRASWRRWTCWSPTTGGTSSPPSPSEPAADQPSLPPPSSEPAGGGGRAGPLRPGGHPRRDSLHGRGACKYRPPAWRLRYNLRKAFLVREKCVRSRVVGNRGRNLLRGRGAWKYRPPAWRLRYVYLQGIHSTRNMYGHVPLGTEEDWSQGAWPRALGVSPQVSEGSPLRRGPVFGSPSKTIGAKGDKPGHSRILGRLAPLPLPQVSEGSPVYTAAGVPRVLGS